MQTAIIIESILDNNQRTYRLKGPLTAADIRNRNGRIYPKSILKEAIYDLIESIKITEVYSYLEHPQHSDLIKEDSCAVFENVTWDDEKGISYCTLKVLNDTRDGQKLIRMLDAGETVGISTRALGSLNEDKIVQPGLKIVTGDIVSMPSCQICQLNLHESVITYEELGDYFVNEEKEECGCKLNQLSLSDKIELQEHLYNQILNSFK